MERLYKTLKEYPGSEVIMSYSKESNTLRIVTTSTQSSSVPGLSADDVRTVFSAGRKLAISVNIPSGVIEEKGAERILAEVQWAVKEIRELEKDSD